MADDSDNEEMGKVIPFPSKKPPETVPVRLEITEEVVHDLVLTIASINMASKYKGEFDKNCEASLQTGNFPCSENCGCYVHMLSSMALELIFDGEESQGARHGIRGEYTLLCNNQPAKRDDESSDESD
jgi:hypothetical protein